MSRSLPDVFVKKRGRYLCVRALWSEPGKGWAISIEDASPGKDTDGMRIGEMVIGKTAVWCYTQEAAQRMQDRAVRLAKVGRIR